MTTNDLKMIMSMVIDIIQNHYIMNYVKSVHTVAIYYAYRDLQVPVSHTEETKLY